MARFASALNIHDLEEMARRRLPRGLFDFMNRGAEDEVTLRRNLQGLKEISLRQRVGVDVSKRDAAITLMGVRQAMPVVVGITGLSGMLRYGGEVDIAEAAVASDIPFTLGTTNFTAINSLPERLRQHLWYQIYPAHKKAVYQHQVDQARDAGAGVLVVTMDSAVPPNREYLRRGGYGVPFKANGKAVGDALLHPGWLFGTYLRYHLRGFPTLGNLPGKVSMFDPGSLGAIRTAEHFTWADVEETRRQWPGRLVLKGLSTGEDARIAAECGADGVIVSNHGGRSLDGCIASIEALPEVVDAAGDRLAVMVDGGFLRGSDIVKALAIGAKAVMIGRGTLYGMVAGGLPGAAHALRIYREEISRTLGLTGVTSVEYLNRDHVQMPRSGSV